MFAARRCAIQRLVVRQNSTTVKNHYQILGLKSSATQAEIKTAYYMLSKVHHPDTNQGSEESLTTFRQVAHAYEILGNVTSRKLYDRGLVVGSSGTTLRNDTEEVDPATRFHIKRERRAQVPTPQDRSTVYDFDAWARAHYLHTKDRKTAARELYNHKKVVANEVERLNKVNMYFLGTLVMLLVILGTITFDSSYDSPSASLAKKEIANERKL